MNYYIQQRFFIYYMAEEKIFTSYIGDSRCTCRNKKPHRPMRLWGNSVFKVKRLCYFR